MQFSWYSLRLSCALILLLGLGLQPAMAQIGGYQSPTASNPSSMTGPGTIGGPAEIKKTTPVMPDVLPGAATRKDRVAPAQGGPIADPTDALFDAINRGDIGSARDAVDRGADLGGHNVLGMTPLDLSVDLGRNDITFLLLSLRKADSNSPQQARGSAPSGKPGTGKTMAATTPAKAVVKAASVRQPAKPATVATLPQQFAGDSGAPNPSAGFLGFGSPR
jgi:hypothetical protein